MKCVRKSRVQDGIPHLRYPLVPNGLPILPQLTGELIDLRDAPVTHYLVQELYIHRDSRIQDVVYPLQPLRILEEVSGKWGGKEREWRMDGRCRRRRWIRVERKVEQSMR